MALVSGSALAGLSMENYSPSIAGLLAGEALKAVAPCYIKSDGLVYECLAGSGTAGSMPMGFTPRQYASGEPVTLFGEGAIFQFNSSLTIGGKLYISNTSAGMLDTAATLGDKAGVAVAINAKDIIVVRADGRGMSTPGGA